MAAGLAVFAAPARAAAAHPSAEDQILIERGRYCLLRLTSAMGRFSQVDPAGRVSTGSFYLHRPGRARFDYDPPSGLVLASNGYRVAVLDRRLHTFNAYPLFATPLGVLLSRDIRIDKQVEIGAVRRTPGGFEIIAWAAAHKGEGSIALEFKDPPLSLTGWRITDPQGGVTRVTLIDFGPSKPMPNRFFDLTPES